MRYESTKEHINLTTVHFSSHRRQSYFRIKKDKASGKTRAWMRRRKEKGYFTNMVRELRTEDTGGYKTMFRMACEDFNVILRVRRRFQEGNIIAVPANRLSKCQHYCGSMQTEAIRWAQQCCVLLANNVNNVPSDYGPLPRWTYLQELEVNILQGERWGEGGTF